MLLRRDASSPFALASLVLANLLPLAGVLWWGWSVLEVLIVYWLESGIVGALNVPKILLAGANADEGTTLTVNGRPVELTGRAANVGLAAFFVLHYGIFWVVHGVFVFALPLFALGASFGATGAPLAPFGPFGPAVPVAPLYDVSVATVALATGSMLLSHGVSFVTNFLGREEYRAVAPDDQMTAPYGRVMVLHATIVFGAFLVATFGSPLPALVLLVLLKTALDVGAHLREHGRATRATPDVGGLLP